MVNWYEEDLLLAVENASRDMLLAIAFQVIAEAKPNMPVDTGFMRNTDYVVGAGEDTFAPKSEVLKSKDGTKSEHRTVNSAPAPEEGQVIAGFAADYTIYQEIERPFLYPALLRVARDAGGIIQAAGRKHFGD